MNEEEGLMIGRTGDPTMSSHALSSCLSVDGVSVFKHFSSGISIKVPPVSLRVGVCLLLFLKEQNSDRESDKSLAGEPCTFSASYSLS